MNDNFTCRPAVEEDFQAVSTFPSSEEELFYMFPGATFPLTAGQLRDVVAVRSDPTVVELRGEVVAFADFIKVRRGKFCSVGNVIVAPQFRRMGAGTYLVSVMENLAASKYGAREVGVACFNRNRLGIELYTKLGYKPYGIEPRVDWKGDRILLIRLSRMLQ